MNSLGRNESKAEKDKQKLIQDRCQTLLTQMLRDEDNKYCVDCDAKGPRWASWNIGIFLCIRCAGIHRNLGVHISKVKSVNLDSWTPEQVVSLQQMGNSRARAVYEATVPDSFRRPQTDSSLENFIRAKYQHKRYIAKEWVPPPPTKVNWDKEIEEEAERLKKRKKDTKPVPQIIRKTISDTPVPPLPKPSSSPKSSRNNVDVNKKNTSVDLLGLDTPSINTSDTNSIQQSNSDDVFTSFLSAPVATTNNTTGSVSDTGKPTTTTTATTDNNNDNNDKRRSSEEESFFNQTVTTSSGGTGDNKMTKDSILALYGNTQQQQQQPIMFNNTAGGLYQQQMNFLPPTNVMYQPNGLIQGNNTMFGGPMSQQHQQQQHMTSNPFFNMSAAGAVGAGQQQFGTQSEHGSAGQDDLLGDFSATVNKLPQQMACMNLNPGMGGVGVNQNMMGMTGLAGGGGGAYQPVGGNYQQFRPANVLPTTNNQHQQHSGTGQTFTMHLWQ